jgi:hypothetical protein
VWQLEQQWSLGEPVHSIFVAIDGDMVAVLARLSNRSERQTLIFYRRDQARWAEVQRLAVDRASRTLAFTVDLVLDGDTLLAGNAVLVRRDGTWAIEHVFDTADDGSQLSAGGLSGDTIVARGDGPEGHGAYVFVRTAGVWRQQQVLRSDGGDDYAAMDFRTIAVHGDRIAVGAFWGGSGRTYVYRRRAGTWTLEQMVAPPDDDGRSFGFAVALDDNSLAVRSDGTNYLVTSGDPLTRVFAFDGKAWQQQAKLEGPGEPGSDVAIDGDALAYGLGHTRWNIEVYVAQRRDGVWSQPTRVAMRGDAPYRFGQFRSFGLSGTSIAVATSDGADATIGVYTKR